MKRRSLLVTLCLLGILFTACSAKARKDAENEQTKEGQNAQTEVGVTAEPTQTATPTLTATVEPTETATPAPEEEKPLTEKERKALNAGTRVVVWGDSLTEGTGGNGVTYPNVLAKIAGCSVLNYGVYAEATTCIAGRQGGMPQLVHPVTIPAAVTDVDVEIENGDGGWDMILVFGDAGINPCTVGGVEGKLWMDFNTGQRKFTRSEPGKEVVLTEGTPIVTYAMRDKHIDDILVIFTGSNDDPTPETIQDVIDVQRDMIAYAGVDRYVIIGLTSKRKMPTIAEDNEILKKEYGKHFLDVRMDLLEHGLQDAGITPTEEDQADIADGFIPRSLLTDESHGTADYYTTIGVALYEKMQELGYLK